MDDELIDQITEHQAVLDEVADLYSQRSQAYGQVWRNYGALANLLNATRKVDRLMNIWWRSTKPSIHKDALDDAFDAINYLVFFIRSAREGNFTGVAPERPDAVLTSLPTKEKS